MAGSLAKPRTLVGLSISDRFPFTFEFPREVVLLLYSLSYKKLQRRFLKFLMLELFPFAGLIFDVNNCLLYVRGFFQMI